MPEGLDPSETVLEIEEEKAHTEEVRDGVWIPSIFEDYKDKLGAGATTKELKRIIRRPKAKVRITGDKTRFDKSFGEQDEKTRSAKIEAGRILISLLDVIAPGADPKKIEKTGLEHGSNIVVVDEEQLKKPRAERAKTLADGMITNLKGVPLMVAAADCAPIGIYDPENEAIGVFHSGWRGSLKQISAKGIEKMAKAYGSKPERLMAVIGPRADGESFEIDQKVLDEFRGAKKEDGSPLYSEEEIKGFIKEKPGKPGYYLLDNGKVIELSLLRSGVPRENIQISGYSTMSKEGSQIFPSERLEGKEDRDSFIFMMGLKEK